MRLAKGALLVALVTLTLCATVSAQGLRPETGQHNLSPAVGTGSPAGGGLGGISCSKFDEYGDLKFEDEMARLDNFAIQLEQDPRTQAYYVIFGSCEGEAAQRSQPEVDYLVNTRGTDRSRIMVINGGCREQLTIELWICPGGTKAPMPTNTGNPCPKCKPESKPSRRRHHRRGRRHGS